ncbi:MAG: aldo/keto reductase [Duodenibacillus sp.]|nr:aldo/keto reductase [Duodenibacillus sp.]
MQPQKNTAPFAFPRIILGTMTFGEQNTIEQAHAHMDWALEHGINFFDCAEMYPVPTKPETQGRTEEYIGAWLKGQEREKLVIATKVAGPGRGWIRGGAFTLAGIREAVEASLRRLGTDYIDLYQIHWPARAVPTFGKTQFVPPERPEDEIPVKAQLEVFARLVEEGKIRALGVSNETSWGVCQFVRCAEEFGLPRIVSIQNAYSLINRQFEQSLTETCWREDVKLLAYSPFAGGVLSGKYLQPGAVGRFSLYEGYSPRYRRPSVAPAVAQYCEIARRHGLSPEELALGFVASRPFVASAIIGATTLAQLKADVAACGTVLSGDILAEIEAVHAGNPNPAI